MTSESLLAHLERDGVERGPGGHRMTQLAWPATRMWEKASHQDGPKMGEGYPERGVAAFVLDAMAGGASCGGYPDVELCCGAAVCGTSRPYVHDCRRLRSLVHYGIVFDGAQTQSVGRVGSLQIGTCCPRRQVSMRVSYGKENRAASACSRA